MNVENILFQLQNCNNFRGGNEDPLLLKGTPINNMEKNIFLDLSKTVTDKTERKRLLDFIRSPYFNLSEKIDLQVSILELAWKWWDGGYTTYWNEEAIFSKIFGQKEPFSQSKFDRLKTSVVALVRRFFAEETRLKQQHPAELLRWEMRYFREKEQFHLYELTEKESRKVLQQRRSRISVADLLEQYLLEDEVAWLYPGENQKKEEEYLVDTITALDSFWLAARARWSCMLLNQKQRSSVDVEVYDQFFIKIIGRLSDYPPVNQAVVALYQQASRLFDPTRDPAIVLDEFLATIKEKCENVSPQIQDELEALAANFCVRQVNKGHFEFTQKQFGILRDRLESKRIYKNGKILASDYLSIATSAMRLPRDVVSTEWVKQFLDSHRKRLYNHEAAEEMVRYNYANYYFHTGDFKNALKNLKETYREINFKIVSKILEIKTLYEMDDERTDDRIEATNAFFRRERKIPAPKRKLLNSFISCLRKLRSTDTMHDTRKLEKLIRDLELNVVAERAWLLEKTNELLTRAKPKKHKS